jgi:hypothetical protein
MSANPAPQSDSPPKKFLSPDGYAVPTETLIAQCDDPQRGIINIGVADQRHLTAPALDHGLSFLITYSTRAYAFACSSPNGNEGDITYTTASHQMFYCNGSSWVTMESSSTVGFGTLKAAITARRPAARRSPAPPRSFPWLAAEPGIRR